MFGVVVENALQEMDEVKMGDKTERKPRYTLAQLLQPSFRLPPITDSRGDTFSPIRATGDGALIVDEVT